MVETPCGATPGTVGGKEEVLPCTSLALPAVTVEIGVGAATVSAKEPGARLGDDFCEPRMTMGEVIEPDET